MFGQQQKPNTTFKQPTMFAPSEHSTEGNRSFANEQVRPLSNSLRNEHEQVLDEAAIAERTNKKTSIGGATQPNGLYEFVLVAVQFSLLAVIVVAFGPSLLWQHTILQIVGSTVIVAAIALGVWAVVSFRQTVRIAPSPSTTGFLVTDGPFAYVRHPMYSALIFGSIGLFLAYPTIVRLLAIVLLTAVLFVKTVYEERLLAQRYSGYSKYIATTGRLLPRVNVQNKKQSEASHPDSV